MGKRSRSSSSEPDSNGHTEKKRGEEDKQVTENENVKEKEKRASFASLGVHEELIGACKGIGWETATEIQTAAIPYGLKGRDIIGLAETGSGKTGAFTLPLLQRLLETPQTLFACILAPTRELAFQIHEVVSALGSAVGAKSTCIVGGVDMMSQAISLAKKPHVVVATPGRLMDHLENTKGFSLRQLRMLILDEADRMLSMDFEEEINNLLEVIPRDRQTFLFSATMTKKVAKLQRASLRNPAKVEVSSKYQTVKTLVQQYIFVPAMYKDVYLCHVLNELSGQTTLIFTSTCHLANKLAVMLRLLGFAAICLHGQMAQSNRLGALNKFKAGARNILIATDVASRGLDIPSVDLVINYDVPSNGKDYIHRVGRTARAGKSGRAVTMVTQYDVELYQRIEAMIDQKLDAFPAPKELVMVMQDRVSEAARQATNDIKTADESKRSSKKFRKQGKNRRR
mmetsp:Transcript_10390/g.11868  ORF Transcript_10390/g.11868 Transcript_10390/m.11868 type:complete len:455 (+) Transcript_10390:114-1478(+)